MGLYFFKGPNGEGNPSIGQGYDTEFPGGDGDECGSSIIISHSVQIYPDFRGKGLGQWAHIERLARYQREFYNYALCTVRRDNEPQLAILRKNGWSRLANTASYLGTPIYLMGRSLK